MRGSSRNQFDLSFGTVCSVCSQETAGFQLEWASGFVIKIFKHILFMWEKFRNVAAGKWCNQSVMKEFGSVVPG